LAVFLGVFSYLPLHQQEWIVAEYFGRFNCQWHKPTLWRSAWNTGQVKK